jgi:methylated-DNA-protein-cysteine methyltransferase-like protein
MKVETFSERVVKLALSIPAGRVTTYGRIARAAGGGGMASQSITGILWKAQKAGLPAEALAKAGKKGIPWHRIVYADGRIWIDDEHRRARMQLYKKEGIEVDEKGRIKDFQDRLFEFE